MWLGLFYLLFGLSQTIAFADEDARTPWFRNSAEWASRRSVRAGLSTEPTMRMLSNGARFDVTIGKRIPLTTFWQRGAHEAFFLGIDGGMLGSFHREKDRGLAIFATETFDGFFGAFLTYTVKGYLAMFRWGHLSAHLVDNAPRFGNSITYSHFFFELTGGRSFVELSKSSNWDLYLQSTVGMNYEDSPPKRNPRFKVGVSGGYSPWGPDKWAILSSIDLLRPGVLGQPSHYTAFLGMGRLERPELTRRPFRVGISHSRGGDSRNQYALDKNRFTSLELQIEM